MNGFNERGVLDGLPNGGTTLHSQVDFIKNSLDWITKEMSKFREEDENLKSQFSKLKGAVVEMQTLMNTKRLSTFDSDISVGYPASGVQSESNLGDPVVQQYTESPRLGRRSRVSAPLANTIPEKPPQPSAPLVEEPEGSPLPERPSQPRVPRRLPPPPPPRRATVPAIAPKQTPPDHQTSPPKPKPESSPVQQRLTNPTAVQPPAISESNSTVANGSEEDKENAPLGPESLNISLDTSIGLNEGDLASDIFAALASKGLDL